MKTTSLKSLLLLMAILCLTFSCQDSFESDSKLSKDQIAYKEKLAQAASFFGKIIQHNDVKAELLGYGKVEANDGEVYVNLKSLFSGGEAARTNSAIVRRIYDIENPAARGSGENDDIDEDDLDYDDFNYEDFVEFISENDISIVAPYLAENFDIDVLGKGSKFTVSYYTDDMNEDIINIEDHTTPGYLIEFNDNSPVYSPVIVNDDYAYLNPTIVLGHFEGYGDEIDYGAPTVPAAPSITPVCSDLSANDILTLKMPRFKLNGNIAPWPWKNRMHLWAAYAELTINASGVPQLAAKTAYLLNDKKVSRKNARNKNWISTNVSHVIHNWPYESKDISLVWGYKKRDSKVEHTLTVSSNGEGSAQTKITSSSGIRLHTSIGFEKCALLYLNRNKIDDGYGLYDGKYTVYRSNQVSMYFTTNFYDH